jgi:hypothetical protein
MVRDRLRQKEHANQHGLRFERCLDNHGNQRQHSTVERFVLKASDGFKASHRIQIVIIIRIQTIPPLQILVRKVSISEIRRLKEVLS